MGAPLFHWPTPNGMPDVAAVWTGTNDMLRRWSIADQITSQGAKIFEDGPGTVFAQAVPGLRTPGDAVSHLVALMLPGQPTAATATALVAYAGSTEVLGATGAIGDATKLNAGLRRLAGAIAATPEFQGR